MRLPPMSPNLNAHAERFVRSIKEECLERMIFVGQASLRRAIMECVAHYHEVVRGAPALAANDGAIERRSRLGGMLNYYHRVTA
jgi:hypothetical protein